MTTLSTYRPDVNRRELLWLAVFLNLQFVAVVLYYALSGVSVTEPRYALYGVVWITVGVLVIYKVRPPSGVDFETRRRAVAIAATYFGLLAVFGGLVGTGVDPEITGFRLAWLPPGWGPAFVYGGPYLTIVLMPAYLVGYLALAYLVYTVVLDASGSAVAGVAGLLSCVSCTWPILSAVAAAVLGGSGVLAAAAMELSYDLSTVVFLATVALLYWRPGFR